VKKRKRPLGLVLIVVYKAVWGTLELLAGMFVSRAPELLRAELADDPQDQLAGWLMAHAPLQPAQLRLVTATLIALGLAKIVLAAGIWYGSWLVRDIALVVLSLAGLFALGALAAHFSLFRLLVAVTDLLIVFYIWRLLPKHLPPRASSGEPQADATLTR
jgi:uncharacterized membrane protein